MARIGYRPNNKIDRNEQITLLHVDYVPQSDGTRRQTSIQKVVWAAVRSVGGHEYAQAALSGRKPQLMAVVSAYDYNGASQFIYDGITYTIYRNYKTTDDAVELYAERQAGNHAS